MHSRQLSRKHDTSWALSTAVATTWHQLGTLDNCRDSSFKKLTNCCMLPWRFVRRYSVVTPTIILFRFLACSISLLRCRVVVFTTLKNCIEHSCAIVKNVPLGELHILNGSFYKKSMSSKPRGDATTTQCTHSRWHADSLKSSLKSSFTT